MNKFLTLTIYLLSITISLAQSIVDFSKPLSHVFSSNESSKIYFIVTDSIFEYQDGKVNFIKNIADVETIKGSKLIVVNEEFYFVDNLGGALYKENQNHIERIDRSFRHKNQLASAVFTYNDTIYKFGGYGFFGARNFITYFSENSKEWEVVIEDPKSKHPPGLFDMKHFILNDKLFVFGGSTINLNNRNSSISNKEIWTFSFEKKIWEQIGRINFENLHYSIFDFINNDKFYFTYRNNIYRFDINKLSLVEYAQNDLLKKINFSFPGNIQNNYLNVFVNKFNSEIQNPNIVSIDLNNLKYKNSKLLFKKSQINSTLIYVLILAIFIITFYFQFKKFSYLRIDNNYIRFRLNKIQLNENELNFMKLLINETIIENSKLLELLPDTYEISHKSRIKNSTIEDLNNKLKIICNNKYLITKTKTKEDRRYYNYKLERI